VAADEAAQIDAVPLPLRWQREPESWHVTDGGSLHVVAGARTDWFVDPQGSTDPTLNAPALLCTPNGDFLLGARVSVDFAATYDAGVLALRQRANLWAKLCFERSPQGEPMVVSVVTRGVSDDCNSFVVDGPSVWLRIARIGTAFAFHASTDGERWRLVRHFALDGARVPSVGFLAQSPTGEGCKVVFERISYRAETLGDLRSGA
jgi:uncharacterized protein